MTVTLCYSKIWYQWKHECCSQQKLPKPNSFCELSFKRYKMSHLKNSFLNCI